jgi:hypothetical protein
VKTIDQNGIVSWIENNVARAEIVMHNIKRADNVLKAAWPVLITFSADGVQSDIADIRAQLKSGELIRMSPQDFAMMLAKSQILTSLRFIQKKGIDEYDRVIRERDGVFEDDF